MSFVVAFIAAGTVRPVPVSRAFDLKTAQDIVDSGNESIARKSRRLGAPSGDRYVALSAESFAARA